MNLFTSTLFWYNDESNSISCIEFYKTFDEKLFVRDKQSVLVKQIRKVTSFTRKILIKKNVLLLIYSVFTFIS